MTTPGLSFVGEDGALLAQVGRLLDVDLHDEDDLARLVMGGVSVRAFNEFASRVPLPKRLVRSVLHRQRRGAGLRLSPVETEAVVRIARTFARAQLVLSEDNRALEWFTTAESYLDGYVPITPLELSMTETGARLVDARLRAHASASTRAEAADALCPSTRMSSRPRTESGPTARL